jgi:hypothetical protein
MSLTVIIASLAVLATLAAAFVQPIVSHWLTPKQKLRVDVTASEYALPPTISREMSAYYYKIRAHGQPAPEFGEFLKRAERLESYFDVIVTNTGKTISQNVILGCSAFGKYVLIHSRNKSEYHTDQQEYFLGDLQPSERGRCQIWSSSYFPSYDRAAREMFSIRDDHNSSKQIILRRYYDTTSHYLLERSHVESLLSALKWGVLPSLVLGLLGFLIAVVARRFGLA